MEHSVWVFTQMTRRQKFDARPGTEWTIFLMLSIGRHVKFDARASKILAPPCLCFGPRVRASDNAGAARPAAREAAPASRE